MRKIVGASGVFTVLALTLLLAAVAWSQVATPSQSLGWSHPSATADAVTHFEANWDNTGYVNVGKNGHPTIVDVFYTPLPALITGSHTVVVRACNIVGCSPDSTPYTFDMVAGEPQAVDGTTIVIIPTPPQP